MASGSPPMCERPRVVLNIKRIDACLVRDSDRLLPGSSLIVRVERLRRRNEVAWSLDETPSARMRSVNPVAV